LDRAEIRESGSAAGQSGGGPANIPVTPYDGIAPEYPASPNVSRMTRLVEHDLPVLPVVAARPDAEL